MTVHGRQIFYREAGPADAPVLALLHGFPTSSYMYRDLIPALADRCRIIAPDYLGYGHSDAPAPDQFTYTFESMTTLITDFVATLGLRRYSVYLRDFGAPIGFRIAARHSRQVSAIISQNGNAYLDGINPAVLASLNAPPDPKCWATRSPWSSPSRSTSPGSPTRPWWTPTAGCTTRSSSTGRATT
ncbi:hypothetical protein GCM10022206_85280 [Streptomyces chiangmaiensis]